MDADCVCAEFADFFEVVDDGGPMCVPVIFEELALGIVVVVNAPDGEGFVVAGECLGVGCDFDLRECGGWCVGGWCVGGGLCGGVE